MTCKKSHIVLLLSLIGFFAVSAIQCVDVFSNDQFIEIDISGEEEGESSKNEEQELKNKELTHRNEIAAFQFDQLLKLNTYKHLLLETDIFFEVSTPPPEFRG